MKKLIYMIAAAAVAIPVVALAQGACGSGSCSKGDKDMAEAKEHMKEGAKAAKDAAFQEQGLVVASGLLGGESIVGVILAFVSVGLSLLG